MSVMEGPLSKWINVMKGWQYRWFVLDDSAGLLSYYTSKEKMVRGARRGCVRLKRAVVGIDDDEDSTFTITVDSKTFHFQAHDPDEREKWIRALEDTILRHAQSHRRWDPSQPQPTMADFDRKLTESDAYLQLLIDQSTELQNVCASTDDSSVRTRCQVILSNVNQILESVKHSIVLLQIAKNTAFPINGVYHPCNSIPESKSPTCPKNKDLSDSSSLPTSVTIPITDNVQVGIEVGRECGENVPGAAISQENLDDNVPELSYSSSDDDDFYDAEEFKGRTITPIGPRLFEDAVETLPADIHRSGTSEIDATTSPAATYPLSNAHIDNVPFCSRNDGSLGLGDPKLDFDSMYEEDDEDLGSLEGHGSVIQHLISQVKIGMDLTKVVLPTFILERRSLLEMYADFFAHPDLFCSIADYNDPRDRMVQVLKWYLSAFHAGRKNEIAKKPYNPILGEVFRCYWNCTDENTNSNGELVTDGPIPWASTHELGFVAEQVSHHPPVSAFYAEHKSKRISFCGHIWTKSKFLGLSVCVNNIGQGCVSLLDLDEEYILNFPSGYGRSILTVPWIELGGTCQITCGKTGYSANVAFLTKPFYGGKKHKISAEVISPADKKPFLLVEGEWNGVMHAKWTDGKTEVFVDTVNLPITKKIVKPIAQQEENESRSLWKEVTAGLKFNNIDKATSAKYALEQKQREEAKERKETNVNWQTKLFSIEGDNWLYNEPLQKRMSLKT